MLKRPHTSGFSLVELFITLAVVVVLAVIGTIIFVNFRTANKVKIIGDEVLSLLRNTQVRSIAQEGNSGWGVYFDNVESAKPKISVFRGSSYSAQNVVSQNAIESELQFLDPASGSTTAIAFQSLRGSLVSGADQSVTMALRSKPNVSTTITVFSNGRVEKIR